MRVIFILTLLLAAAPACDRETDVSEDEALESSREEGEESPDLVEVPTPPAVTLERQPRPEGEYPDYQLATVVRMRLMVDPVTSGDELIVSSHDGVIHLAGNAETGLSSARSEVIARATEGVSGFENEIVAPAPSQSERSTAGTIPASVLAIEPAFAHRPLNYGTRALVELAPIVHREVYVPPPPRIQQTYSVRVGDSLWDIAAETMGSGARWQELYEANRSVIGNNPMRLRSGIELSIPE